MVRIVQTPASWGDYDRPSADWEYTRKNADKPSRKKPLYSASNDPQYVLRQKKLKDAEAKLPPAEPLDTVIGDEAESTDIL